MTAEERFQQIENVLHMVSNNMVLFHTEMQEIKEVQTRHEKELHRQADLLDKQRLLIEEHRVLIEEDRAAIKDLIILNRSFLESQKDASAKMDRLSEEWRESHRATEEKLDSLIETVDRIIRNKDAS
jgi:hypothetical protein